MFRRLWLWARGVVWLSVAALLVAVSAVVVAALGLSWVVVVSLVGLALVLALISS